MESGNCGLLPVLVRQGTFRTPGLTAILDRTSIWEAQAMRDFEDHCWKDIVDQEIVEIYEPYRREVRVGCRPAVLAIDLYNKVYQGGDRPVREVNRRYSGSCGEYAWGAL